ncbi:hypothetical protein ACFPM7_10605 [Actinokineospora guangxiensis]|uniref:Uncharacterized protein n=1 Tax=Actinokineospora guangxiensis TaxID=1490288 RepID=A0ABW0EL68_9PSEU
MNVTADDFPAVPFNEDGERLPFSEPEIDRLVPLMTEHYAPRRFALCQIDRDDEGRPFDVCVIAWGLQVGQDDDSVVVFGYPDGSDRAMHGTFQSADNALRILRGRDDVRLAWADPETA